MTVITKRNPLAKARKYWGQLTVWRLELVWYITQLFIRKPDHTICHWQTKITTNKLIPSVFETSVFLPTEEPDFNGFIMVRRFESFLHEFNENITSGFSYFNSLEKGEDALRNYEVRSTNSFCRLMMVIIMLRSIIIVRVYWYQSVLFHNTSPMLRKFFYRSTADWLILCNKIFSEFWKVMNCIQIWYLIFDISSWSPRFSLMYRCP